MKMHTIIFVFFALIFTLRSTSIPSYDLLGVAPEDEMYYKGLWSSGTIKCKDGSKTFTKGQLNDDFCDCFDGSDEPGTSACPTGKFFCRNAGHSPVSIFSSRINDGICDCCDGSDEYDGKTKCRNTCWDAGKVARDKLMKKIETFKEGVVLRKKEVEEAKILVAKDEAELSKLKNEEKVLKGVVEQLKEHKERIEKEVEKERLQKEKEEKQKKEAEESESKEHKDEEHKNNDNDESKILDDTPLSQEDPAEEVVHDAHESFDIEEKHAAHEEEVSEVEHVSDPDPDTGLGSKDEDATKDIDSLSREELGREIGSRWTGKKPEEKNNDFENSNYDSSDNVLDEESNGYDSETDEDHHHYEEDEENHTDDFENEANDESSSSYKYEEDDEVEISDMESTSSPSLFEKTQRIFRNFLQAVNPFQAPVNISEAENVRKEYDEASGKLSKIRSKISRLKKKLEMDFGQEKEFYSLYGQCFKSKQNKYVYKVCPFKEATQEEGYSTTRLGEWEKFEDSYSAMLFSNGANCWNGPDRSLKVKLRCGSKVEVADVDEPSRCEYEATLTTPALCLEGKLKELEDELETLTKEQPQFHDEL